MTHITDFLYRTVHDATTLQLLGIINIIVELPEREWNEFLYHLGNMNLRPVIPAADEVQYAGITVRKKQK